MTTTYPERMRPLRTEQTTLVPVLPEMLRHRPDRTAQTEPCDEQDCDEVIEDEHYLCRTHWQQFRKPKYQSARNAGNTNPRTTRSAGDATRSQTPANAAI